MRFLERTKSRGGKYWGDITTKKGQPTFRKEGDETPARKTTLWGHLAWGQEAHPISGQPSPHPPPHPALPGVPACSSTVTL